MWNITKYTGTTPPAPEPPTPEQLAYSFAKERWQWEYDYGPIEVARYAAERFAGPDFSPEKVQAIARGVKRYYDERMAERAAEAERKRLIESIVNEVFK